MGLFGEKLPNIPAFMVSGKESMGSDVGMKRFFCSKHVVER